MEKTKRWVAGRVAAALLAAGAITACGGSGESEPGTASIATTDGPTATGEPAETPSTSISTAPSSESLVTGSLGACEAVQKESSAFVGFAEDEGFEAQRAGMLALSTEVLGNYDIAEPPVMAEQAFTANVDAWRIMQRSFEDATEPIEYLTSYRDAMRSRFGAQGELDVLMAEFREWTSAECGIEETGNWFFEEA